MHTYCSAQNLDWVRLMANISLTVSKWRPSEIFKNNKVLNGLFFLQQLVSPNKCWYSKTLHSFFFIFSYLDTIVITKDNQSNNCNVFVWRCHSINIYLNTIQKYWTNLRALFLQHDQNGRGKHRVSQITCPLLVSWIIQGEKRWDGVPTITFSCL